MHGYPTSSYDFHRVVTLLEDDHFRLPSTAGYGLGTSRAVTTATPSPTTRACWTSWCARTFGLDRFTLSRTTVATASAWRPGPRSSRGRAVRRDRPGGAQRERLALLAQLTCIQKALLNDVTGPPLSRLPPTRRSPAARPPDLHPALDVEETAAIEALAHQDGMRVQHQLIQYLRERRVHESSWLESSGLRTGALVAVVWGERRHHRTARVADFVWGAAPARPRRAVGVLARPAPTTTPQLDQPGVVAELLRAMPWTDPGRTAAGARPVAAHG